MITWHNEPSLKIHAIKMLGQHRKDDRLRRRSYGHVDYDRQGGQYVRKWRGCFIWCLAGARDEHISADVLRHRIGKMYGLPYVLTHILENVFELSPTLNDAEWWVMNSAASIPVGVEGYICRRELDRIHAETSLYVESTHRWSQRAARAIRQLRDLPRIEHAERDPFLDHRSDRVDVEDISNVDLVGTPLTGLLAATGS